MKSCKKSIYLLMCVTLAGVMATGAACSTPSGAAMADAPSAQEYYRQFQDTAGDRRASRLETDQAYLRQLQKDAEEAIYYLAFLMSFGPGEKPTESVSEFSLDADLDQARRMFENFSEALYYEQDFIANATPADGSASALSFGSTYYPDADDDGQEALLRRIKEHTSYSVDACYHGEQAMADCSTGLKRIDRVEVTAQLALPVAADTFQIKKQDGHLRYADQRVDVLDWDDNQISLLVPRALHDRVLAYQAYNPQGLRMDSNAYSSTPAMEIAPHVMAQITALRELLDEAVAAGDPAPLAEVTQEQMDTQARLADLLAFADEVMDDEAEDGDVRQRMEQLLTRGRDLLAAERQLVMLEFPDEVAALDGFVAGDAEHLRARRTLQYDPESYPYNNPDGLFVFHDARADRYGLSDADGHIVAPARHPQIRWQGKRYYGNHKGALYRWNASAGELERIRGFDAYERSLASGYDVLSKRVRPDGYDYDLSMEGVVQGRQVVIPVDQYDYIEQQDDGLVMARLLDEPTRSPFDVYGDGLKKLPLHGHAAEARQFRHVIAVRPFQDDDGHAGDGAPLVFYTRQGEPIASARAIHGIDSVDVTEAGQATGEAYFVARGERGRRALFDEQLRPLTDFDFSRTSPLPGHSACLLVTLDPEWRADGPLQGLMDHSGRALTPLRFAALRVAGEGDGLVIQYDTGGTGEAARGQLPLAAFLHKDWEALFESVAVEPDEDRIEPSPEDVEVIDNGPADDGAVPVELVDVEP